MFASVKGGVGAKFDGEATNETKGVTAFRDFRKSNKSLDLPRVQFASADTVISM